MGIALIQYPLEVGVVQIVAEQVAVLVLRILRPAHTEEPLAVVVLPVLGLGLTVVQGEVLYHRFRFGGTHCM